MRALALSLSCACARCAASDSPLRTPSFSALSAPQGFFLCFRAVQLLKAALPASGIVIVGLAGPSGAGKTVFGEKLRELLPGSALLSMDMYNDGARVVDANYDDPRLTDYDTLLVR
jgi:uridine kinase